MTAVAQLPDPGTRVLEQLGSARAAVKDAGGANLQMLTDDQLAAAVTEIAAIQSQTDAFRMVIAREAERREAGTKDADTGTDAYLSKLTGEQREKVRGGLKLAERLQEAYPATLHALAAGTIRLEQARVIVAGLDVSIDDATEEQRQTAESLLIAKASGESTRSGRPLSVPQLRRAARRIYDKIDTDLAIRHLLRSVRANNQRGATDTWMTLHDNGDGTFSRRFGIPELHGKLLRTILENLSAPRRCHVDKDGNEQWDDVAGGKSGGLGWADKLGLALCELIEHLPVDKLPKSAITMLVKLDLDTLRAELSKAGVGETSTGTDVDAGEVRRLACEAGLVPAVLGSASVPLDLGCTSRLHSDKQRQALALLYDTCAIEGCDRPIAWCEIHHLQPWSQGGGTDLDNALPACWHHHRAIHDIRYQLEKQPSGIWTLRWKRR